MQEVLIRQFTKDRTYYLGYLTVLTRDPHMAEDLLQEVFVIVMKDHDKFDASRDFGAWVRGICRNLALAELRKSRKQIAVPPSELTEALNAAFEAADPEELAQRTERFAALQRCLQKLSAHTRNLLALRYDEGLPLEEIGRRDGKSAKAMQMLLSRARKALGECMARQELATP